MKVSAIVVTYNGEDYIDDCLKSLLKSKIQLDIYVIDNNSKDSTKDIVKRHKPYLKKIIFSDNNLGFGKANNIALELCLDYDFCFLINQDAYIEDVTVENLINIWKQNQNFGIISPIHLNSSNELDFMFKTYLRQGEEGNSDIVDVEFVNAALWLISGACLRKVGLFDSIYPHYGEDGNYCDRVRYHGFKIGIVTNAKAWHIRNQNFDIKKLFRIFNLLNMSILINPSYSFFESIFKGFVHCLKISKGQISNKLNLETILLSLKLFYQYFGHLTKVLKYQKIKNVSKKNFFDAFLPNKNV